MKTIAKVLLAVSAFALVTASCAEETPYPRGYVFERSSVGEDSCEVETFMGGGSQTILYFSCTSRDFAKALADYQASHPDTRIVSHSGDGMGFSGAEIGYTVVTEPYTPQETAE